MTTMRLSKHDLSADDVLAGLAVRYGPYYQPIAKTRHLGYRKGLKGDEWYARIRTRAGDHDGMYGVGGFLEMVIVHTGGIVRWDAHEWPDQIGAPLILMPGMRCHHFPW